jgi:hypothetical protein
LGAAVLDLSVGTSGGEIRHTEIRENALPNAVSTNTEDSEKIQRVESNTILTKKSTLS